MGSGGNAADFVCRTRTCTERSRIVGGNLISPHSSIGPFSDGLPLELHRDVRLQLHALACNLGNFLQQNREALKCDVVVVSDTGMIARLTPTLSYGLRGVAALGLKVTGPKMDLHSGIYGGAVANPAAALARLLATLHDRSREARAAADLLEPVALQMLLQLAVRDIGQLTDL